MRPGEPLADAAFYAFLAIVLAVGIIWAEPVRFGAGGLGFISGFCAMLALYRLSEVE